MKTTNDPRTERWLLPDGVNELMPAEAWRVESLRRLIMDSSYRWGYELVMPPLIEYLDSLLTGTGETLGLQTFKFIDQHNGRSLGVRADMTPQVARIDAHAMRSEQPNRLFYIGSVLRTRSDGAGSSRTPLQFGAELFGHAGPASDTEIIQLMLNNVMLSGLQESELLLDVGHVGVFRGLILDSGFSEELSEALFQALLRGSRPEVQELLQQASASPQACQYFTDLTALAGEADSVLARARLCFADAGPAVSQALDNLQSVIDSVRLVFPGLKVHVDLAELRGYRYHTGIVFALYDDAGSELARGGRYDAIGESFGRARPATGFSGDLVSLALARNSIEQSMAPAAVGIWVDSAIDNELWMQICLLRQSGERVVTALPGSSMSASDCHCDRTLANRDGVWKVEVLKS
ncbi:ATP phosphoribosyltransferase regulatory subunit [Granulosicoccus antarcticus]|uniref:ATP phosphoribosyltransferase regulatory subunit n=1 Tax=Granulosicoccus antarcticus IMCC3135 TaxID=1192854 RepID=A0A2Z2P5G7_9GAMM|nr:ATP phosphoribosyltransferase regulatory subunit [Granulosicoccus antarcticus]ASJ75074.1 ATP phosphoribosyltransferase regulatory subunit [Granulosicoccus antarcticus IMCC3135]